MALPSYEKIDKLQLEASVLDQELLKLSQKRDALLGEYERLQENPKRTMKARARAQELEEELNSVSSEITVIRKKLRDIGCYNRE
jgi:uncharacterized coiled-coil DUF342 family protein